MNKMSIQQIRLNIMQEKQLLMRLEWLFNNSYKIKAKERANFNNAVKSTINQIKILNNSLPSLIKSVSLIKKLPPNMPEIRQYSQKNADSQELNELVSISHKTQENIPNYSASDNIVAIKKSEKQDYLKELHISESYLKDIRKKKKITGEFSDEFKKPNPYIVISNKIFSKLSNKFIDNGNFGNLKNSLRKGNFITILNSYVSMILFTSLLALFLGIILTVFFHLSDSPKARFI